MPRCWSGASRFAGGAGGEDDARELLARNREFKILRRAGRQRLRAFQHSDRHGESGLGQGRGGQLGLEDDTGQRSALRQLAEARSCIDDHTLTARTDEHQPGLADGELMQQRRNVDRRRDRHRDRPGLEDREVGGDVEQTVGSQQRDAILRLYAMRTQPARQLVAALVEFSIRPASSVGNAGRPERVGQDQCFFLRPPRGGVLKQLVDEPGTCDGGSPRHFAQCEISVTASHSCGDRCR
jgi:hypothetical protein